MGWRGMSGNVGGIPNHTPTSGRDVGMFPPPKGARAHSVAD